MFGDGKLRVAVGGQRWTFSPSCLVACRPAEDASLAAAEPARENKSAPVGSEGQRGRGSPAPLTEALLPGSLSLALEKLRAQKGDLEHPGRLVAEVALGNMARALELLRRHPEQVRPPLLAAYASSGSGPSAGPDTAAPGQVDAKNQGRTALQVASYLGQGELVRLLLQGRASVDLPDDEGSTALHYAALG